MAKNKNAGYDEISFNVLRNNFNSLITPLKHILNIFLTDEVFPHKLKIAPVSTTIKKVNASEISKYRPISVLSCFCKIPKRILFNRVFEYLIEIELLFKKQFCF